MTELAEAVAAISLNSSGSIETVPVEVRALSNRRNSAMGSTYRLFYSQPVNVVRASGTKMWDASGQELLDAYNNVVSVGHAHPRVVDAVSKQFATVTTNTRYLQESVVDYAEDLVSTFDETLGKVIFTCTGSEANDLAMRLARQVTGGTGVIVSEFAYHGGTAEVASWSPAMGKSVPLAQHVRVVPAPNHLMVDPADLPEWFAGKVRSAIEDMERHGIRLAAFIVDSLFSSDGIFPNPQDVLVPIIEIVRRAGGVVISDEVQSGFGRTGAALWGHQRASIVPDIVTMGKPMGNGMPMAGVVTRDDLMEEFGSHVPYFNTFGGGTAQIAAAQAVLDVIRDENLIENTSVQGRALMDGLTELTQKYLPRSDVRGAGLYIGVEFFLDDDFRRPDPHLTLAIVNEMRQQGVLISVAGPYGSVLKIRPPLVFSSSDTDRLLTVFEQVLRGIETY